MAEALKEIYNENYVRLLSQALEKEYMAFDTKRFTSDVFDNKWQGKALKQRMRHITLQMAKQLPSYKQAIPLLINVFGHLKQDFNLENMIFQDYVEVYGLDDFDLSMEALEYFTKESSSEFAIRQFILKEPERTMNQMKLWAKSSNLDVRRLASEGCRPRLPWAVNIPYFRKNPKMVLEVLELLKDDESTYVRTSVANNLNDISKDNPLIFKKTVKSWYGENEKRNNLLKYASRTLLKRRDKTLLTLFGLDSKQISVSDIKMPQKVYLGEELHFTCKISSPKKLGKVRIETVIHLIRQKGKKLKKSFKVYDGNVSSDYKIINKKVSFSTLSTRKYYEGEHYFELIINGDTFYSNTFLLQNREKKS